MGNFNVDAAVKRMFSPVKFNIAKFKGSKVPATGKSVGGCATAVRTFIEAGGINTTGRPTAAKDYVTFLPKKGFTCIATLVGLSAQAAFKAQKGDIAVMGHGSYGHICMWSGTQWVSDFPQQKMWPYTGEGTCKVFRHSSVA